MIYLIFAIFPKINSLEHWIFQTWGGCELPAVDAGTEPWSSEEQQVLFTASHLASPCSFYNYVNFTSAYFSFPFFVYNTRDQILHISLCLFLFSFLTLCFYSLTTEMLGMEHLVTWCLCDPFARSRLLSGNY